MVFDQQSYSSVDYNISTVKAKSTCSNHASHRNKKEHKVKDFQETISGNFQSLDITVPDITTGNKKNRKEKKRRKKEIGTAKREAKNAEIRKVRDRLVIACFFALIFMCVEIVGGIMAGSLAIVTDAAHLLSDIFGFATAILASTLALRPSSDSHTFGLVRAEVLSALINTAMIVVLAGFLLYEGILKLVKWAKGEDEPINGFIMMIVALVGVFFNIILMVVFGAEHEATHSHDHCHGHSHSHGHHHHHSHNHDDHQAMIYPMSGISKNDEDNVTLLDIEASRSHYGSTDVNNISKEETHNHNHHHHHHHKNSIDENNYETASNESQSPIHWTKNINLEAAHLHVWTDLLQSVGVAIAGILIYFKPEWSIVDPIITIVFLFL